MMLSASAPELEVALPLGPNENGAAQQMFAASQVVLTSAIEEGGYLGNNTVITDATATLNYSSGSLTIVDLLSSGSGFESLFDRNDVVDTTELFGTTGPVPRVIIFTTRTESSPTIQPLESPQGEVPPEGGWVSIMPMLKSNLPSGKANKIESALASASAESSREAESYAAASPDDEHLLSQISGEWARAAVFEIAGGEPAGETLSVQKPQDEFVPAATSSANIQAAGSAKIGSADLDAAEPDERDQAGKTIVVAAATEAADNVAAISVTSDADAHSTFESADLVAQSRLGIAWYDRASRAGLLANPSAALPPDALAAAFDEFGDGETALASSSPDYLRLDRWLNSTPLLLIIALERVTSRRSRPRQAGQTTGGGRRDRVR